MSPARSQPVVETLTPATDLRSAATSPLQDGLWYADRLAPGCAAANRCRAYRVTGPLDIDALAVAWHRVLRCHAALRTTVREVDGRPIQCVAPPPQQVTPLVPVDLTAGGELPEVERVRRLDRWCSGQAATGFDLEAGPAVRFEVARLGVDDHALLLVVHRVIADERSMAILIEDLGTACAGASPGPDDHDDYARFARESRERLRHIDIRDLAAVPAYLDLPADVVAPVAPWPAAGTTRLAGAEAARPGLLRLAADAGTTPEIVLLTAFLTVLHRHTGAALISVATPSVPAGAGRIVGACTNLVPVVGDFTGGPTFRKLLERVVAAVREAHAGADVPLAELIRRIDPPRDPRRTPFCDAVFVPAGSGTPLRLPRAEVRTHPVDNGAADADLVLAVAGFEPALVATLRHRTAVCDAPAAVRWCGQLRVLLHAVAVDPDQAVDRLPLESDDELRAAVRAADRITDGPAVTAPVHERIRDHVRERPGAIAVDAADGRLTYAELQHTAGAIVAALRRDGPVNGLPVAVRMPPGALQLAVVLAVLRAGAHLVPLDAGEVGERGRSILAGLRPARLVVSGAAATDAVTDWYAREHAGRVLDAATAALGVPDPVDVAGPLTGPAYLTHTSGSTGRPKGIPQTHATLAQFTGWFAAAFGLGPGTRVAQWAAPSYDAGLVEAFAALTAGATCCVVPERIRAHPDRLLDWLAEQRVTVLQTVPSFARELLAATVRRGTTSGLDGLDHLLLAGEALHGRLADVLRAALPRVRLINLYGATETILATWHEVSGPYPATVPVGAAIPGRQVLIVDEHDRPCPAGVTGRIVVHSPYVTAGYVGGDSSDGAVFRPVRDAAVLSPHAGRWYRTGDLGRRRWDGALEFRGRDDQQIKFNGVRLELTEIEAVLSARPEVADCAVVAATGPGGRVARLVVHVVAAAAPGLADELRKAVRRHLGRLTVPVVFRTVPALPRNAGGKVDRVALAAAAALGTAGPGSPVQAALAPIFAGVLHTAPPDPRQSFTAAGGHSLLVPVLLHQVHRQFGVRVTVADFQADPTLAGLAAAVEIADPGLAARLATASAPGASPGADSPTVVRVVGGSP